MLHKAGKPEDLTGNYRPLSLTSCFGKLGFCKGHPTTGIFLDVEKAFDQVWYDGLLFQLASMGLNRKLIRWISNFLYQRKLIVSINDQLSDPITPIHGVPKAAPSPILFILYASDVPQPLDA